MLDVDIYHTWPQLPALKQRAEHGAQFLPVVFAAWNRFGCTQPLTTLHAGQNRSGLQRETTVRLCFVFGTCSRWGQEKDVLCPQICDYPELMEATEHSRRILEAEFGSKRRGGVPSLQAALTAVQSAPNPAPAQVHQDYETHSQFVFVALLIEHVLIHTEVEKPWRPTTVVNEYYEHCEY